MPSLLVEFRKRLTDDILGEINEMNVDRLTAFSLCEFLESIFQGTWLAVFNCLASENAIEPVRLEMAGC